MMSIIRSIRHFPIAPAPWTDDMKIQLACDDEMNGDLDCLLCVSIAAKEQYLVAGEAIYHHGSAKPAGM